MAAPREHQGYQIALVIFVMTTVLLSITTFMFFRKYKEEQDKNTQAVTDFNASKKEGVKLASELTGVKSLLGYTNNEPVEVINKDQLVDRAIYEPYYSKNAPAAVQPAPMTEEGVADEESSAVVEITNPLNYRDVVKQMKVELDKRSADMVKLADDKEVQVKTIATNRAEDKAKTDAASAGMATAQTELTTERGTFNKEREDFKTKTNQVTSALTGKQTAMSELDTTLTNQIQALKGQLTREIRVRDQLAGEVKATRLKDFEQTDGEVTSVIARDRTVYLNLGSSDGLRPQVTFSVYSRDNDKLAASESKAKVEVIQISGPKSSIARIIEDSRGNPIMPGDKVFSPAFHPGRKVRFALAGDMDIGLQRVRDLISINGGIIDVEVTPEGKRVGNSGAARPAVTGQTRYLILGEAPADPKVLDMYSTLITEAKSFGVQQMNVQQFLDMMGYKTDERTVGLGKGANPADFVPKRGSAYDKPFRERRPPAAASSGTNGVK